MQSQHPSLLRVISTDYPSFLSVMFPIAFGGFSAYFFFTGNAALQLFLSLAIIVTVVGIPVLLQRYRMISYMFADGSETPGTVTGIFFFRGRGRINYAYTFQGQNYTSRTAVNKNSRTRNLRVGQKVKVLIDRGNPKRAIIQEIYL